MYDNNGNIVKRREFGFTLKNNTLLVVGLIIKNLFLCFTVIGIGLAIAVLVDIITVVVLMLESKRRNDMTKKYN